MNTEREPGKGHKTYFVEGQESPSVPMGSGCREMQGNVWSWVCESGLNNKTQVKDRDEKHKI